MAPTPDTFELFETMAYLPRSGLRNEAAHLARLSASADHFGFRLDLPEIRASLHRCVAGQDEPVLVRLRLGAGGAVAITLRPLPAPPVRPVRLAVDHEPVDSRSVWLSHKTTRREAYDLRATRHPYADDVVLVNERGQLTESTIANLAVRLGETWFTPPVESGCLPGVERGRLVREGRLTERVLSVANVAVNNGLALVSSVRSWRSAEFVTPSRAATGSE